MPSTGSHIFAYESSSAAYKFLLNGNLIGTASGNYNFGSGQTWGIGYNGINNGAILNGDIAEVILYNRALSAGEADQFGAYLATKYFPAAPPSLRLSGPDKGDARLNPVISSQPKSTPHQQSTRISSSQTNKYKSAPHDSQNSPISLQTRILPDGETTALPLAPVAVDLSGCDGPCCIARRALGFA